MSSNKDELRPEYPPDLIKSGVRGKYAKRYKEGTNVVLLDPEVARAFPTSEAVNKALRKLIKDNKESSNSSLT